MVLLTSITAEFRGYIGASIPHIIALLENNYKDVCAAGAAALVKLSEQGM
jgi:hypothetical protein